MKPIAIAGRWLLWSSIAVIGFLTLVWPFAISPDPSHPAFKIIAIAALIGFIFSLTVILAEKACRGPRT